MTDKLPHNLLALFAPRPALRYLNPIDHAPEARITNRLGGVGQFMDAFREYKDKDLFVDSGECWLQKKDRQKLEQKAKQKHLLEEGIKEYKPANDPNVRGDAFKTLFVARLNYEATEKDLESEFGRFGPIERIRIVKNPNEKKPKKKHTGYAFVVYEREKDMKGNNIYTLPSIR
ncbi:hypothetical protein BU16DRAFT_471027 [Lophium mytilinum]|uniref:RRM domain-containing protein n=1 Tax=Lophium mytilinum TaxID=390894 RepID=A0A6A6QAW9_9PEZI|nr:hypothetical protein BU16DRAFT_471027 [Lophium mytilinum]